jgi:hypothetical protein
MEGADLFPAFFGEFHDQWLPPWGNFHDVQT